MTDNLIGMGISDNIIEPDENVTEQMQQELSSLQNRLAGMPEGSDDLARNRLLLDIATLLIAMDRKNEAWDIARPLFDAFIAAASWQDAVETCDILYAADHDESIIALGNGVWLAVTYPIDPTLTVNMLNYIIDETPAKADGAAVAAITAHYVADVRAEADQHKSLTFLTKQLIANVAKEHSGVEDQEGLTAWMERLELLTPDVFLPRLSLVLGAIVPADEWWFDRDALRDKIPE